MIKNYKPIYIEENVNVSKTNPVKELIMFSFYSFLIVTFFYFVFGVISDIVVTSLSPDTEQKITSSIARSYRNKGFIKTRKNLQKILDKLVSNTKQNNLKHNIYVINDNNINAFALPGRNIVLTSGLIQKVDSENELAFVIAHELGHIVHKDSLKAMSRNILMSLTLQLFFRQNGSASDIFSLSSNGLNLNFSRKIETRTDLWAIDLLNKTYNNVLGSFSFFDKCEKYNELFYYFSTHPSPQKRKSLLKKRILDENYTMGEMRPINKIKEVLKEELETAPKCKHCHLSGN